MEYNEVWKRENKKALFLDLREIERNRKEHFGCSSKYSKIVDILVCGWYQKVFNFRPIYTYINIPKKNVKCITFSLSFVRDHSLNPSKTIRLGPFARFGMSPLSGISTILLRIFWGPVTHRLIMYAARPATWGVAILEPFIVLFKLLSQTLLILTLRDV